MAGAKVKPRIVAEIKSDGFSWFIAPEGWTMDLENAVTFDSIGAAQDAIRNAGLPDHSMDLVNYLSVRRGWVLAT